VSYVKGEALSIFTASLFCALILLSKPSSGFSFLSLYLNAEGLFFVSLLLRAFFRKEFRVADNHLPLGYNGSSVSVPDGD
jgi:hypothetical protein